MAKRTRPKRGVVLLIVLILLMLLIITGLTFAIISGQFRRAAEAGGKKDLVGDDPQRLLDRTMRQLVRDTPAGVRSSLRGHSLLRDLYGTDSPLGSNQPALGNVVGRTLQVGGQFVEITFDSGIGFHDQAGYYNGCVLTFSTAVNAVGEVASPAVSVRVVQYNPTGAGTGTLIVEAPEGDSADQIYPALGRPFIINGRPFNGKGAGYDVATGTLDAELPPGSGQPVALLPNYDNYPPGVVVPNAGGLDEAWDAVDYQNMFLAMIPAEPSIGMIPSFHRPALVNYWLKRFATEVLVPAGIADPLTQINIFRFPYGPDYRLETRTEWWEDPDNLDPAIIQQVIDLKRLIILRPLPEDHPDFPNADAFNYSMGMFNSSGVPAEPTSLTLAQLVLGSDTDGDGNPDSNWLDIDNDGDGIPDSIWLDAGLPIQTSKDGRRYKPMVAILCQDLDGRLNVNAHSNQRHRLTSAYAGSSGDLVQAPGPADAPAPLAGSATGHELLPRGLGVGAADVFLGHLFASSTEYQQLMNVRYADTIINAAGISDTDDWLSGIKSLGIPVNYGDVTQFSAYGMPPDLWGRGALGLDHNGQPIPIYSGEVGETVSDPYEMVLSRKSAGNTDHPFSVAELERLLRWNDVDAASLPDRLLRSAPVTFDGNTPVAHRNRSLVTTHSSHLPVPSGMVPAEMRADVAALTSMSATSILDLYRARFDASVASADVQTQMELIVPWEIWHGERFDLNRWFGNGRDDNNNGVVDEPSESELDGSGSPIVPPQQYVWSSGTPGGFGNNVLFPNSVDARQHYARHLYCLMMLLTNEGYLHPTQEPLNDFYREELTAQRIAQWAVNVVDFRDSDAIMTPFEYDKDPFNDQFINWDPTNNTTDSGDRRVVWGTECTDLLLTETVAFHDRRVKDTIYDPSGKSMGSGTDPDEDPDQFRIPQGSLFLELYCTKNRATNNRQFPSELYVNGMLDLARRAPSDEYPQVDVVAAMPPGVDRIEISWPVWRVVISEPLEPATGPQASAISNPDSTSFNPNDMDVVHASGSSLTVGTNPIDLERVVWLTPGFSYVTASDLVGPYADFDLDAGAAAYRPTAFAGMLLSPGGYAVIGPRENTNIGMMDDHDSKIMTLARSPHFLEMPLATRSFRVRDNDGVFRYGVPAPPFGIICGAEAPEEWDSIRPIGLSVSEPLPQYGYYPEPTYNDTYADPDDPDLDNDMISVNVLPDVPFDDEMGPVSDLDSASETDTVTNYRAAFLQRLANPLVPFHPLINPYITVDWATIDLTVFNGEDDPSEPEGDIRFATRQRGNAELADPAPMYGTNYPSAALTYPDFMLWNPLTREPVGTQENGALADLYFKHNLSHSLGYLNGTMGPPLLVPPEYAGAPTTPFPWLTWNNRPFANPMELMMVPCSTPSRLVYEFDVVRSGWTTDDPYDSESPPDYQQFRGMFRHLLNFFHSSKTSGTGTAGADFYRLFDYVGTPSPFVGAEKWYNPDPANGFVASYQPPYNHLSRFQDPGRVNINTIFDLKVWEGISKGYPAMDPTNTTTGIGAEMSRRIFESRRGYSGDLLAFNSDYPTLFANPFRCADSADLMPDVPDPSDATKNLRKTEPVQATLLREDVLNSPTDPLFVPEGNFFNQPHQDQRRNPFFRYQGVSRLSNLVTDQSNVFAVWITVGYFEVEPNPTSSSAPGGIDVAHPDGFRLAREVGSDSGSVKRHRGFYIIDRSVPVAFEPGKNHNIDRAVLLRRFIE